MSINQDNRKIKLYVPSYFTILDYSLNNYLVRKINLQIKKLYNIY